MWKSHWTLMLVWKSPNGCEIGCVYVGVKVSKWERYPVYIQCKDHCHKHRENKDNPYITRAGKQCRGGQTVTKSCLFSTLKKNTYHSGSKVISPRSLNYSWNVVKKLKLHLNLSLFLWKKHHEHHDRCTSLHELSCLRLADVKSLNPTIKALLLKGYTSAQCFT